MLGQQRLQVRLDPVLDQPGSTPRSWLESLSTSPIEICSVSPSRPRTSQTAVSGSAATARCRPGRLGNAAESPAAR